MAQRAVFVVALVAACQSPPPQETPVAHVDAARPPPRASDAAPPDTPPRQVPTVKPQCRGADLDLDKVFTDFACLGENLGPMPGLEVTLSGPSTVAAGGSVELAITWTNTKDTPVGWGMITMPGYDLFLLRATDAHGQLVLETYPCQRGPQGHDGAPIAIVFEPHGIGHVKRTWRAARSVGKCGDGYPLEPGTYQIIVSLDPMIKVKPFTVVVTP